MRLDETEFEQFISRIREIGKYSSLPPTFQWSRDNVDKFDFGAQVATDRIVKWIKDTYS